MCTDMAMKILALLLGFSCCVAGSLKTSCPPQESTTCSCRAQPLEVTCSGIGDEKDLKRILQQLQGYSIKHLELSDVDAKSMPTDLFEGLHVEDLVLTRFEVNDGSIDCDSGYQLLHGLETSLKYFQFRSSFRKRPMKCLKLDNMKILIDFSLEDSNITEVGNDWTLNLPNSLGIQFLINNGLGQLGDKAFQRLTNLAIIVVRRNNISKISRSMLPNPAQHLITLDFKYNKIGELPKDIFSNMPSLKEVNFANNFLYKLPSDTWVNILPQLRMLFIPDNYFLCDHEMKWICEYRTGIITGKCFLPGEYRDLTIHQFCKQSN